MAQYHVGCGIAAIYAGIMKSNGYEWKTQSDVTAEAIASVAIYMAMNMDPGKSSITYKVMQNPQTILKITVEKEIEQ